jgi:GNAT superfamily N-acetyltransferase
VQESRPTGLAYLAEVSGLLQAARLAHPTAGLWEAADLQWWWRADQHEDDRRQLFFRDSGRPVAAVVLDAVGGRLQCDLFQVDHGDRRLTAGLFERAMGMLEEFPDKEVELFVQDDEPLLLELAASAGFSHSGEDVTAWIRAGDERLGPELPRGFRLGSRAGRTGLHHLAKRNGEHVAKRLSECSLYRADLDLFVETAEGEPAAYGLFWADPVTGVGLVEPVRTEDRYQGLGLASHLVGRGLELLGRAGCRRCKISYDPANEPAGRAYLRRGFVPTTRSRILTRPPG